MNIYEILILVGMVFAGLYAYYSYKKGIDHKLV